jgi:phage terminase large subunit-like protein
MSLPDPLDWTEKATPEQREDFLAGLSEREREEWRYHWRLFARDAQRAPSGDWRVWLIMAGRGFGKTRAGSEWVREVAEADPSARIALVAATLAEGRSVMIEGESGLLAHCAPWRQPRFEPSLRRLTWANGAQAILYSAGEAESLRGPQHSHAWCDEIAKWDNAQGQAGRTWDNLLLGLRLGKSPRIVATTTPRAVPLVLRLVGRAVRDGDVIVTRGRTQENRHNLPSRFIADIEREFGGTLLGRQELEGELVEDVPGALWSRALLERCREPAGAAPPPRRVVAAVDPPASAEGDACGIVVAALGQDGIARVVADGTVERASPERWARAVAEIAAAWECDRVIAEANQGGAMVETVLRAAAVSLPLRLVRATRGKSARAEPVAALYEAGRVRHAGMFAALEDQLCGLMAGGEYCGPGRSPDRADAAVWALTELMLAQRGEPRVWAG